MFSAFLFAPLALAQDSDPEAGSPTEEYAPQSEIVTVLNEKNEDGIYVAGRSEDGYPTMTFRLTVPNDAENFYYFGCFYREGFGSNDGYAYMYCGDKYKENLRLGLGGQTVLSVDGDTLSKFFKAFGVKNAVSEGYAASYDYTLEIRDVTNRKFNSLVGKEIQITIPSLAIISRVKKGDPTYVSAKYKPQAYSFVSGENKEVVRIFGETVKTSELNNIEDTTSLYLNGGSMLVVDGDFACKNIYIEAADEANMGLPAGVVINRGASLVADSIYFMPNFEDERSVGYLINNGVCSAGSVFVKNAQNSRKLDCAYANRYNYLFSEQTTGNLYPVDRWAISLPSFSSPVKEREGWVDMSYRIKNGNVYTTGVWSPFAKSSMKEWMGLSNFMQWNEYFKADSTYGKAAPFYIMHIYTNASLRLEGEINDDDSYSLPLKNLAEEGKSAQTFVSNPYPAPVDWRSVADQAIEADGDSSFVAAVRDIQYGFYKRSLFSIYNLKTGITTLDVPNKMYYGYIQPNMTNVSLLHQTGERAEVKFAKSNLTSYQEADEKYAGKDYTNGLPYVRLYVDEVVDSLRKGVGRRSVVALYFVPKAQFDDLHSGTCEDYDPVYDVNTLWESLAETRLKSVYPLSNFGGGHVFPYVGVHGVNQTNGDIAAAIKMVAIPEPDDIALPTEQYIEAMNVLKNFIRISIEPRLKTTDVAAVEFGVVDYDLKDSHIGIKVGGLSLNYPDEPDVLKTTITTKEGYMDETRKGFVGNKMFCEWECRQISLNLTVAKGVEKPNSGEELPLPSVNLTAGSGVISVSSSVAGQLRVYDLLGRLVAENAVPSGMTQVSMPAGSFVAKFVSSESSVVKKLIVK